MTAAVSASTASGKSSECRSQFAETGNSRAGFLAETPSLTLSSAEGSTNSSTNAGQHDLYRSASITSDQHSVRSPVDEPDDSATWSLETGPEGVHTLLPMTNTRNVFDFSAFSWPLSAADTDYQFDFDIPFTVEQADVSTGSTALAQGDTALLFNRSTRAFESPESSDEIIRSLNLNNKVYKDSLKLYLV
jgi:hypothetical protein